MQCWPHPRVEAAGVDAAARVCTAAVLGTSHISEEKITTMTVHNRKKKFSHKVENIGTIYQRLKVHLLNRSSDLVIIVNFRTET